MFATTMTKPEEKTIAGSPSSHSNSPSLVAPRLGEGSTNRAFMLQRTIGNQAVLRLMAEQRDKSLLRNHREQGVISEAPPSQLSRMCTDCEAPMLQTKPAPLPKPAPGIAADSPPIVQRQSKGSSDAAAQPDETLEDMLKDQEHLEKVRNKLEMLLFALQEIYQQQGELREQQQEAKDPIFVRNDPGLTRLKAELQEEKRKLPEELFVAQKDITKAEKDFLKADDRLAELEGEQRLLAEDRESFEKRLPLLAFVVEALENEVKSSKNAAAKEMEKKLALISTLESYMADKQEYIREKDKALQEMRRMLELRGLSAARRAGVSTETPISNEPGALLDTRTLIQTLIEASPLLAPYLSGRRIGNINLRDATKFVVDDTAFNNAVRELMSNSRTLEIPQGDKIGGYYNRAANTDNRKPDTIYLPVTAHLVEGLHEAIHKYSLPLPGHYQNEGFTQYLADRILEEQHLPKAENVAYHRPVECARKLIDDFGFDAVARLYFFGAEARALREAILHRDEHCAN